VSDVTRNARLIKHREAIRVVEIRENETVISISELERLRAELSSLKQERDRAASGKLNCADCGSILARW
jgi:hypothetical protein